MMNVDIFEKVKVLVAEELKVKEEEIKPESDFVKDLNADSLDVVEFIMALEEKFDIKIPDESAEKIKTVQDVVNYIAEYQAASE
ncbi:acyl carrier protein [Helicobacter muridarum]|uniref:Acyl carrier protein n=1 Tax=Helicobacter muridarum TaxID=216 RepID=A0A377PVU3_9HELI|nr:acyl carrier protein [Helicobacter muridarum]TLE01723.1 acyl carrier protein [Helicobacter muridarum]STQ86371.1 acyl carrier protein [Helicobacter muridarum]